MVKPETFANVASGIQSLVVSFAVVVGGIWSLYTFNALNQVKIARTELTKAQDEVNQLALDITLTAKQTQPISSDKYGMLVDVSVHNAGKRPIKVDLKNQPLTISRMVKDDTNNLRASKSYAPTIYKDIGINDRTPLNWQQVQPGSTRVIEFYQEVEDAGMYHITFNSSMSSDVQRMLSEREAGTEQEVDESKYIYNPFGTWYAQKFINIDNPNKENQHRSTKRLKAFVARLIPMLGAQGRIR